MSYLKAKFAVHATRLAKLHLVLFVLAYLFFGAVLSIEAGQPVHHKLGLVVGMVIVTLCSFLLHLGFFFLPRGKKSQRIIVLSMEDA